MSRSRPCEVYYATFSVVDWLEVEFQQKLAVWCQAEIQFTKPCRRSRFRGQSEAGGRAAGFVQRPFIPPPRDAIAVRLTRKLAEEDGVSVGPRGAQENDDVVSGDAAGSPRAVAD